MSLPKDSLQVRSRISSHFRKLFSIPLRRAGSPGCGPFIPGTGITESALTLVATVPGIDDATFQELAAKAKAGCPVSGALGAIDITLDARLA